MKPSWLASLVVALGLIATPGGAVASTFSNTTPIAINNSVSATPYPSTVSVGGVPGAVVRARATLIGVSHKVPTDIDALLVAPGGQKTLLMSDVCGDDTTPLTGRTLTFDDAAPASLPSAGPCPSGTYKPSKEPVFDPDFPPPAPPGDQTTIAMSALHGGAANGAWQLFVQDAGGASDTIGSIAGGWSLELLTDATCAGMPATITGTAGNDELIGTEGPDVILGLDGDDTIRALAGDDVACGGNGNDKVKGGTGRDKLLGQQGNDKLKGGKGKDTCKGGKGKDSASGCEREKSI